jgi:hypothetical protein
MTDDKIMKALMNRDNTPLEAAVTRRIDALTEMLDQMRTGAQQSGRVVGKLRAIALLDEISVAVADHLDSSEDKGIKTC